MLPLLVISNDPEILDLRPFEIDRKLHLIRLCKALSDPGANPSGLNLRKLLSHGLFDQRLDILRRAHLRIERWNSGTARHKRAIWNRDATATLPEAAGLGLKRLHVCMTTCRRQLQRSAMLIATGHSFDSSKPQRGGMML